MLKALLCKQFQELTSVLVLNPKTGKRRSIGSLVGYCLLMAYVLVVMGALFFLMADTLCGPLWSMGNGWLYFALMGTMATAIGVVGSVFATASSLYQAGDNELLLSMPIPPRQILAVRMLGVYVIDWLFEAVVMIPTCVVYWLEIGFSAGTLALSLLVWLILPVLALALSCLLGWLVALIASRLKHKNVVTMVLSLAFLAGYFYLYSQATQYLQMILLYSEEIGGYLRVVMYPLYQMGMAFTGSASGFVYFTLILAALFVLVYWVLSRSFLRIATEKHTAAKARYREKIYNRRTPARAALGKELRLFTQSATYMLNGGLGSLVLVVGAAAAVIRGGWLRETLQIFPAVYLAPLCCMAVCAAAAMNLITAPSVSLEGKNLWIYQSLPVSGWTVLQSKLRLHLLITGLPALLCMTVLAIILRLGFWDALLSLGCCAAFVTLSGAMGLAINLKLPNLEWTTEAAAVKQSGSVLLSMLLNLVSVIALCVLSCLLYRVAPGVSLLVLPLVLSAAAVLLLLRWLRGRGVRIFLSL